MHGDERVREPDGIERRIDAALRSYAEPENIPAARAVTARVLEQVRALEARRRRFLVWGLVGAAACLLVALVLRAEWMLQSPPAPQIASAPSVPEVPGQYTHPVVSKGTARQGGVPAVRAARVAATRPLPKLEVFPTPRPLSPEEQALIVFGKQAPTAVRKAVIEDQQHWDDPIIVAEIQRPPLESGSQYH